MNGSASCDCTCYIFENTLKEIPLHKLRIAHELMFNAPTQNLTKLASKTMQSLIEKCQKYIESGGAGRELNPPIPNW